MCPYVTQFATKSGVLYNPVIRLLDHPIDISRNNAFLYIGRLSEEKGIHDFCKVMTELQLQGIVLGDGYLLDDLKHQYPNITFAGWVNGNDKMTYLKQAKCLVFPSKVNETFGLSVAEMLSMGVPCIVPLGCGAAELIKNGVNGLNYEMGNLVQLKDTIKQFEEIDISDWATKMKASKLPTFSMQVYLMNLEKIFSNI
nr:glycosyltransferase [Segatella maculosa]